MPGIIAATQIVLSVLYQPMMYPALLFGEQRCDGQKSLMDSFVVIYFFLFVIFFNVVSFERYCVNSLYSVTLSVPSLHYT
jgi:hypothetical protein